MESNVAGVGLSASGFTGEPRSASSFPTSPASAAGAVPSLSRPGEPRARPIARSYQRVVLDSLQPEPVDRPMRSRTPRTSGLAAASCQSTLNSGSGRAPLETSRVNRSRLSATVSRSFSVRGGAWETAG